MTKEEERLEMEKCVFCCGGSDLELPVQITTYYYHITCRWLNRSRIPNEIPIPFEDLGLQEIKP